MGDAEGLYRVPGNRAHVDLLFQNFDEDPKVDIDELDIAVNAVATAVKDFFFKRLPPILEDDHMAELETISMIPDRSIKVLELGKLIKRLPKTNFAVLKFIFQHFVKVTESSKDNCMDSKNLAICWWPTLLQYEFGDLGKFESYKWLASRTTCNLLTLSLSTKSNLALHSSCREIFLTKKKPFPQKKKKKKKKKK